MRNNWSLVLFTLLVQTAVGGVWCAQAFLIMNGGVGSFSLKFQILTALCLVLAGLAAATTHLGKPSAGPLAVKNLKSSWLSREIITVNLFAGVLAVIAVSNQFHLVVLSGWFTIVASLAGGAVLYAMTRVYRLRTVPTWNHAGTPLHFIGSTLLLGGLLSLLIMSTLMVFQAIDHDTSAVNASRNIAFVSALIGLVFKTLAAWMKPSAAADATGPFKPQQPIIQGCGVALWAVFIFSGDNPTFDTALLILISVSLIAGEIIHRIRFYDSYRRVGL